MKPSQEETDVLICFAFFSGSPAKENEDQDISTQATALSSKSVSVRSPTEISWPTAGCWTSFGHCWGRGILGSMPSTSSTCLDTIREDKGGPAMMGQM